MFATILERGLLDLPDLLDLLCEAEKEVATSLRMEVLPPPNMIVTFTFAAG